MLLANKQQQPLTCPVVDRRRVVGGERKLQILTFSDAGRGETKALPLFSRFLVVVCVVFSF
jgi:hypothetical protein